jgi:hypothetical protein
VKRERELMRQGMMGPAHNILDNLRDLINDDLFSNEEIESQVANLLAVIRVARMISSPISDPFEIFVNIMDHIDPLPEENED